LPLHPRSEETGFCGYQASSDNKLCVSQVAGNQPTVRQKTQQRHLANQRSILLVLEYSPSYQEIVQGEKQM
jgi:hypothetical protein